jgi:poly(A) polymerase
MQVYKGDSFHLMPVITPAYPSMCATFNITRSSMSIIQRELKRGLEISEKIITGKRPWSDLFVKHTFFTAGYKYYISVISTSKTQETHKIWSGYVESKVRMLVQKLEQHPNIALAHAFNKGYERRHICQTPEQISQVQEGSLRYLVKDADVKLPSETSDTQGNSVKIEDGTQDKSQAQDQNGAVENGSHQANEQNEIFTTTHYIGLELGGTSLSVLHSRIMALASACPLYSPKSHHIQHPMVSYIPQNSYRSPGDELY